MPSRAASRCGWSKATLYAAPPPASPDPRLRIGASGPPPGIIRAFPIAWITAVEAERLNLIETTLNDLARRADELRGYL
jgi:hypothetical protein